MHKLKFKYFLTATIGLTAFAANGQNLPPFASQETTYQSISLNEYLKDLNEKNATIKSKKLTTDSAINIAKQAGTPNLSPILTYARGSIYTQAPYAGYTNPASNTLGATVTIEGWNKRSSRETYAQAEANRNLAEMVNETHSTETLAIMNYIDALRTKLLWQSYQLGINKLAKINSSEAKQKITEFKVQQKTLANDLKFYSYGLMQYLSTPLESLPLPMGSLNIQPKAFKVQELISKAQESRSEISASNASIESANANLEVVKASRNPDLLPGIFYTQTPSYYSSGQAYGNQNSVSFILSIPLSNGLLNNSDEIAAANNVASQEANLLETKTKIITEINQTYLQYKATEERLQNAELGLKKMTSSSNNGVQGIANYQNALVELIDARTTHAKTLIILERLGGSFEAPNLN